MKLHIDTAPVWEVYRQDCECPLCSLSERAEAAGVDYFLGESVMEPSQRIEVNEKGFCSRHFKQMFAIGNHLGLALMTHTYMKQVNLKLEDSAKRLREAAEREAGKPVFKRVIGKKGVGMQESIDALRHFEEKCVLCERLRDNMQRYVYTLIHLYKTDGQFRETFSGSKGLCLKHYVDALEMASEHLSGATLQQFVDALTELETRNMKRLEGEIEWYTLKFDYRNDDKPWGNSRDSVKRSINKLRGAVIED